jgi:anti-sigma B factor antagonist
MSPSSPSAVRFEQIGKVTVVRFQRPRILDEWDVASTSGPLLALVEKQGRHNVLLDFGGVERLTTDFLGKLITLHQKAQALGGRLALCGLHPDVYPIFETLGLPKLLHIYPDERSALQSF